MNRTQRVIVQSALTVLVLGLTTAIVVEVPHLTGSTWHDVRHSLDGIPIDTALGIVALWFAGLACYTIAMTASMPGLSHRRALALNLSGSSVSNILPFGGVLGTGLNLAMVRSWRLSLRSFASSTAVLNIVNLLAKLVLPIVAGIVVSRQHGISPWLGRSAYIASAITAGVVIVVVLALISKSWAARLDRLLHRLMRRRRAKIEAEANAEANVHANVHANADAAIDAATGRPAETAAATAVPAGTAPAPAVPAAARPGPVALIQGEVRDIFRLRWARLMGGLTGYVLLQWALFALCLHTVGIKGAAGSVFAAFAVERALTLAVITPAGTGVAEAGATALLVALGFPPAASAAGVLLYRLFVYLAEIPVGALVVAGWASMRLRRRRRQSVTSRSAGEAEGDVSAIPISSTTTPPAASRR
jgi:uncharacterized membrane protein YbhN (UPF0104 family)